MEIIHKINPLQIQYILNQEEKLKIYNQIKEAEYRELYEDLLYSLSDLKNKTEEEIQAFKISKYTMASRAEIEDQCCRVCSYLIDSLKDTHVGDCTSYPSSCAKCEALEYLGIKEPLTFGKSLNYYLLRAFQQKSPLPIILEHFKTKSEEAYLLYKNYLEAHNFI